MSNKENYNLCLDKCTALCCTGISIPIDKPKNQDDIEELRFYIVHKNVNIYIRSNRWYILVNETCEHLTKKNLCGIYEDRPLICRKFSNDACEYWGDYYDTLFTSDEELKAYFSKKTKKKAAKKAVKKSAEKVLKKTVKKTVKKTAKKTGKKQVKKGLKKKSVK